MNPQPPKKQRDPKKDQRDFMIIRMICALAALAMLIYRLVSPMTEIKTGKVNILSALMNGIYEVAGNSGVIMLFAIVFFGFAFWAYKDYKKYRGMV